MKQLNRLTMLIFILTGSYIFTGSVCAEPIQKIINFQGFLTTSDGVAVVDDTYTMTFSLWDGPNDSTAAKLWDENVQLTVTRGLYSVNLGESNPIPYTLNFGDQHYIGVQLGAGDMLKINGSLIPTVNAWHAFRADTVSGRNVRSINQSSTLEETDDIVLTSGTITVTLPPAANVPEKWYTIKKMDDNATTLTIDTSNGELINDTDSMNITKEWIDLSIISNGLQWYSVGSTLISGITTTQLLDNVITSAKIEDATITGSDFQNSAVDTTQLADNSITSDKIANNTITGSDIQNSAINTTQLADNSVTPSKLAGNPGNGISGETLLSQGDGTFRWEDVGGAFTTQEITGDHTVETGNVGIGTLTPTEKLEVDGNIKITNGLILANGPGSVSQTILKALSQSETRTISLPDASGVVIVTEDGSVTIPDGSITASKLANNPGNGITGNVLFSNGDGSFVWGDSRETFTTIEGSASFNFSFGSNGTDIGQFDSGIHIAIDSNGNIYVADIDNNRIQVFTSSGSYSYSIGTDNQGFDQGEFCNPDYIELDTNNNIYVTENCGHRVQVFTSSGEYSYSIGSFGSDPGQFNRPAGIVIDNNGNIFVADSMNHRIQVFTASGEYSYSIGTGSSGSDPGQFSQPKGLALDSKGNLYVTDLFNHRIQVFTASGNYSYSFGGEGAEPGQFSFPYGICVDSNDLIYTAETGNDRIQVFSASGSFEYSISVNSPMGVKVYNDKIYVASVGDSQIQVYNKPLSTHTVESGNIGIGTTSPTEKLEVDGNVKITNNLILANGSNSISQTILRAMTQSEARTITLPDASGIVLVTDDGSITVPDGTITASKLANNPGNGITGQVLISNGDGTFDWENPGGIFTSEGNTHIVETGNVGIGTGSPTEKLEVDGNVKITNDLILANGSSSVSQTILKAMTQSEARTITLPDSSGIVVVTDDGNITVPDGSITASKLANNPGNGITGQTLISNGDGTFVWGDVESVFTTIEGRSSASLEYSISCVDPLDVAVDSNGKIYVCEGSQKTCHGLYCFRGFFLQYRNR
jgi:hypothetical protein